MKPGLLNFDYFGGIFFHAYDWSRYDVPGHFGFSCKMTKMKLILLDSVGCLDSELL